MELTIDVQTRGSFVLPEPASRWHYLYGAIDRDCWTGPGLGFDCCRGTKVPGADRPEGPSRVGAGAQRRGTVQGPWAQEERPIRGKDGGRGMVFRAFDGSLFMTLHTPDRTPDERPRFVEVEERELSLRVAGGAAGGTVGP